MPSTIASSCETLCCAAETSTMERMANIHRTQPKQHHGVIVPIVTPLTDKLELDEAALRRVIDHQISGGVQGIFVLGSNGEGPSVPRSMRTRIVQLTMEHTHGRARVYAGMLDNSVVEALAFAKEFLRMGVAAVVAQMPNYFPMSPDQQFRYFASLAEKLPGSILLYDIPVTVHSAIDLAVIEHMRAFSNVVGIKDSSGNQERIQALLDAYQEDPEFSVLIGASGLYGNSLQMGADGIVPGAANLEPEICARMMAAAQTGDWQLVNELQAQLDQTTSEFMVAGNFGQTIARMKYVMSQRGLCGAAVFPPLETVTE